MQINFIKEIKELNPSWISEFFYWLKEENKRKKYFSGKKKIKKNIKKEKEEKIIFLNSEMRYVPESEITEEMWNRETQEWVENYKKNKF